MGRPSRTPSRGSERRAAGCSRWRRRAAHARATDAPLEPVAGAAHHRHRALPPHRELAAVRGLATTHSACTSTWACRGRSAQCRSPSSAAGGDAGAARDLGQLGFPRRPPPACTHARSQIFTKSFRAAGIPDAFGGLRAYADYIDLLVQTNSIVEFTQCGGACGPTMPTGLSRCGSATPRRARRTPSALAGLITACVVQAALDHDEGGRSRTGRPADRGELLARDQERARRPADRPRGVEEYRPPRRRSGCWPGRPRRAPRSASIRPCPRRTGRSARSERSRAERRSRRSTRPELALTGTDIRERGGGQVSAKGAHRGGVARSAATCADRRCPAPDGGFAGQSRRTEAGGEGGARPRGRRRRPSTPLG